MKLKIENQLFQLPERWSDITVKKYLAIQKIITDKELEDKEVYIIQVLGEIEDVILQKCSVKSLKEAYNQLKFLNTDLPITDLKEIVRVGKQEYYFDHNLDNASHGMMTDLKSYLKGELNENITKICAVLFRPVSRKKYNYKQWKGLRKSNYVSEIEIEEYNAAQIAQRAIDFEELPIDVANTAATFFLIFSKELFQITVDSLKQEAIQEGISLT